MSLVKRHLIALFHSDRSLMQNKLKTAFSRALKARLTFPDRHHYNKLCGRPPQYAPAPCKLTCDLLTLKVAVLCSQDHGLETRVHSSSFCPGLGLGLGLETWKRSWQQHCFSSVGSSKFFDDFLSYKRTHKGKNITSCDRGNEEHKDNIPGYTFVAWHRTPSVDAFTYQNISKAYGALQLLCLSWVVCMVIDADTSDRVYVWHCLFAFKSFIADRLLRHDGAAD